MKILYLPAHYVFDDHQYGTEPDLAYNIVNRVAREHNQSVVVTGRQNLLAEPNYRLIEVQPHSQGFDMSFVNALKFNLRYTWQALRLLRSEQFDLLHHVRPFTIGATFNLAVLMNAHKKLPFVIGAFCLPYDDKDPSNSSQIRNALFHAIERFAGIVLKPLSNATLRKADAIFVIDRATQRAVQQIAPQSKVVIVPPAKNKDTYTFNPAKEHHKGELTFLTSGNFISRKNIDQIIEAFVLVAKQYPKATLRLVGSGYDEPKLRALVKQHGLDKQVSFVGRVSFSDMPDIYAAADVYVAMPSQEAFGHVYIEAMASGLPIISTTTVGSKSILSDKAFGKLIPPGDIQAMAEQMQYFLNHPEVFPDLSAAARAAFEANYSWDVIIPRYTNIYHELLKEHAEIAD